MEGEDTQRSCGIADTRLCAVFAPLPRRVSVCTSERRMAFLGLEAAVGEIGDRRRREARRVGRVRCIVAVLCRLSVRMLSLWRDVG